MKKLAILAVAGLMSVTASAGDWLQIGESPDGEKIFIAPDLIIDSGGNKQAFFMLVLNGIKESPIGKYNTMFGFQEIDCNLPMRVRALSLMMKLDDKITYQSNTPTEWNIAYPGSNAQGMANFICSY